MAQDTKPYFFAAGACYWEPPQVQLLMRGKLHKQIWSEAGLLTLPGKKGSHSSGKWGRFHNSNPFLEIHKAHDYVKGYTHKNIQLCLMQLSKDMFGQRTLKYLYIKLNVCTSVFPQR